jgi:hypothetical protein
LTVTFDFSSDFDVGLKAPLKFRTCRGLLLLNELPAAVAAAFGEGSEIARLKKMEIGENK